MIATFGLESTLPISGAPSWPHGIASETRLSFERAVDFWTVFDKNRAMLDKPMERARRKANPLGEVEEAIV